MSILRPPALRAGDAVMLVSPSGPPNTERVARGIELLTGWGLSVRLGADVYARHGYFAGTDDQRLASFNAALSDPGIRALVCTRGGYGAQRIVDLATLTGAIIVALGSTYAGMFSNDDALCEQISERTVSRLTEMCAELPVTGHDRRMG